MCKLSAPDPDLVGRVTSKVGFDQRLVGYRIRRRAGALVKPLYSFEEVVHLLDDSRPYLSVEDLVKWVRSVIRDEELADRMAEAAGGESSDYERLLRVKALMGERLCQCKKAVGAH